MIECGPIEAIQRLTDKVTEESALKRCEMVNLICSYLQGSPAQSRIIEVLEGNCRIKLLRDLTEE